ncbi:N-acetylmuramoyl-L-alanine amidase-like domain-containing protein, partial [Thermodesulfobacteriota bacterium]
NGRAITGCCRPVTSGEGCKKIHRTLSEMQDLPPKVVSFSFLPRRGVNDFRPRIESGDLVFFVSTRETLDVFHTGILVWGGTGLVLRHASRSRGRVIEEELAAFLAENHMAGVIVVRPLQPERDSPST